MAKKFRLALIQTDSTGSAKENRIFIEQKIREAKESGAALVILPEHADAVDFKAERNHPTVSDPANIFYAGLAAKYGLYLHCGSYAETDDAVRSDSTAPADSAGLPYNTSLMFDPDGRQIASYRKLHMFDVKVEGGAQINESDTVSAGSSLTVVETPLCALGLSICYDLRFPELYRLLALNGAELLVVSANFTAKTGLAHWEPLLRARAIENACYIAAVNQCGTNRHFRAYGHTMWIDPWGRVLSELQTDPGMLITEFDPEKVDRARRQIPVLENRRSDIYRLVSECVRVFRTPQMK